MTYLCYIKSHCKYPDFEMEVEAASREEARQKILAVINNQNEDPWDGKMIDPYIEQL